MSKVLVIEDNIEISENIVEILELADYEYLWPKMANKVLKWLR
jgi:DNA-binding response OmpR family regulator